jgi:hypothetical protein
MLPACLLDSVLILYTLFREAVYYEGVLISP